MNKIGKIAHNISVRNTSQNDFIKIEITPSVFNIFARTFWNRLYIKNCISSLLSAKMFDVGLQGDRDILKYIVGILKYIKVYPRVKIGKNPTF